MVDQVENETNITLTTNSTQITVGNLFPYYTYEVIIAAVTNPGTGPWSSLLTVMLPEAGNYISLHCGCDRNQRGDMSNLVGIYQKLVRIHVYIPVVSTLSFHAA